EFCATRTDGDGVLVLSEFAGAAAQLGGALRVKPYDVEGMARALKTALTMPAPERHARMEQMRERVFSSDVHHWVERFLSELEAEPPEGTPRSFALSTHDELEALVARFRAAKSRVLLLDYDGTLVPLEQRPEQAWPRPELKELLGELARREHTEVHVVSGRPRPVLDEWLGDLPLG